MRFSFGRFQFGGRADDSALLWVGESSGFRFRIGGGHLFTGGGASGAALLRDARAN